MKRHLKEINFYYGTFTVNDILLIVRHLLSRMIGKEDIIDGQFIKNFEEEFARYIGLNSAFTFGKGRMALYAVLKAIGISKGDEVILPGFTCVVVPNAIVYCGAKPCYVDIDSSTYNIDISKIEEKITPKTKAIIAQHTFGLSADMDKLIKIAEKYKLKVIEDCAAALGAEYKGKKVGSFGDAAIFSLEITKGITSGWGGIAGTNNVDIMTKLELEQKKSRFLERKILNKIVAQIFLSYFFYHPLNYWIGKYIISALIKAGFFIRSITDEERLADRPPDYPFKFSNIQARIALNQLKNIKKYNKMRAQIAKIFSSLFESEGFKINRFNESTYKHVWLRYPFTVKDRRRAIKFYKRHQIELGQWFNSVIHPNESPLKKLYYVTGSCPNAETISARCVNLPTHWRLSKGDIKRIVRVTQKFIQKENNETEF